MWKLNTDEPDILRSYEMHATCFVAKPVDRGEFMAVIRSIADYWGNTVQLPLHG
jgi:DNA-binding NarL/FixJ family response regulator